MPSEIPSTNRSFWANTTGLAFPVLIVMSVLVLISPLPPALLDLLLAANFQSFRLAFAVLATVPAVLLGVLLALIFTGDTVNIQSFMGAIMAIGIAVANSILMVTFAEMARSRSWWVLLLAAGLGAPLAEEMLFRGFLYSGLRASPLGFAGTALVTALFWTSLHATYSPYGLVLLLMIGLYFAWLRERSGSVWLSIAAHAVYNGLIVLALAFAPAEQLPGG